MAIKKVTIRDVAREAGVSVTLVSFVMNAKVGKDGRLDCPVNPKTAARVLEVAKRLGYRKNNAAASLRSGRSHTIALLIPHTRPVIPSFSPVRTRVGRNLGIS